jgi:hypothetical protein
LTTGQGVSELETTPQTDAELRHHIAELKALLAGG